MSVDLPFPDLALQQRLRHYITATWDTLTRDLSHPTLATADFKVEGSDTTTATLIYISDREDATAVLATIRSKIGNRADGIEIRTLPPEPTAITEHGLLYLPGPYVVPGGRFNEFYGWDSYFIQRGLILAGRPTLAASMVEQALYEVEHYGTVLNANRTYYLTRSHPPVLSLMVKAQFEVSPNKIWLSNLLPLLEKFYYYWRVPPHLNQATGLSRYFDLGEGPAPEVEHSERDENGLTHYDRVRAFLRVNDPSSYDKNLYYNRDADTLTELAFKGDRSMRESGFDPTDRFGALNLDVIHYAPVCLNVLLYRMERDLAEFHRLVDRDACSEIWDARADASAEAIEKYFWNEEAGLYFDFSLRTNQQRHYPFLTTFWPMWAGLCSKSQAARIRNNLAFFRCAGGLMTSTRHTGEQWDAPFVWAPLQLLAVLGLERYGFHTEAREIARDFIAMAAACFDSSGVLSEKYDGERCSTDVVDRIDFGYSSNESGFGWSNAVLLEFLQRFS